MHVLWCGLASIIVKHINGLTWCFQATFQPPTRSAFNNSPLRFLSAILFQVAAISASPSQTLISHRTSHPHPTTHPLHFAPIFPYTFHTPSTCTSLSTRLPFPYTSPTLSPHTQLPLQFPLPPPSFPSTFYQPLSPPTHP